jgi:hypothetical protein
MRTPGRGEEDKGDRHDEVIFRLVHQCAVAAADLTAQRSCGLIELDRYEAKVSDMTDECVKRILVIVEELVQSRLPSNQPQTRPLSSGLIAGAATLATPP